MNEHTKHRDIFVAVVGSKSSGKSALTAALVQEVAKADKHLSFTEIHDLDDLHGHRFDVVLQVVDCANLEESLMLTPHILDESEKIVLALGRYDILRQTNHSIRIERFREQVGVPVQLVSVRRQQGLGELVSLVEQADSQPVSIAHPIYHAWEQKDEDAYRAWVHGILTETLIHAPNDTHTPVERINYILTSPWTGFPILAMLLGFVFWCTFALGEPIQDWLQMGVDALYEWTQQVLPAGWLASLLGDGIILGVGSLLTALPNIIILFFFLSVMEDTGYMARVAFLMDGVMHRIGLHGRSFIPMLMGFDCNVPAIMAAKDIRNPRDRALTMLMVPFMSCSARLPVYILIINAFFPTYRAMVLLSLYLLGILISFAFALLMKHTPWLGQPSHDCVNELPLFRLPTLRSIGGHIWYRVSDFLQKISTVVLFASVIIWALEYFPAGDLEHLNDSWLAAIGKALEPVMLPLGQDWKMAVCLLTGLPAKEAIAATFAILFGGNMASAGLTPASAYAFLVFVLLYFPCVATVSTLRRELGWKWAAFQVVHSLLLAWCVAFVFYRVGVLLGLG